MSLLQKLKQHPDCPRWTYKATDMLKVKDRKNLDVFRSKLKRQRRPYAQQVPIALKNHILDRASHTFFHAEKNFIANKSNLSWQKIPTMSRENVAAQLVNLIPDDADLNRMIIYKTAGTTGHPLNVPHDPLAVACYLAFVELALKRYGINPRFSPDKVACFLVGAQVKTVTYPTILTGWKSAGFAKLNLNTSEWPSSTSSRRFIRDFNPLILTGDPISFSEMLRLGIECTPKALITTAVAMNKVLKTKLEKHFKCPVIDWYSLTETGPIAYGCPLEKGYHLLAHDVFVEVLDSKGKVLPKGKIGEVTVSGGRNPFLPLVRYRTGDWGAMDYTACKCGDTMPRLTKLEGRKPVLFRSKDGSLVNTVDVSRILREFPIVQHEFKQKTNYSCDIVIRPIGSADTIDQMLLQEKLKGLFGDGIPFNIEIDMELGNRRAGKTLAYQSEFLLED